MDTTQDSCPGHVYGVPAVVMQHKGTRVTLQVPVAGKKKGEIVAQTYTCGEEDVRETPKLPPEQIVIKNLNCLTMGESRFLLRAGGGYARSLTPCKRPSMLDDVHLKTYWEWLQWQYAQPKVSFADPTVVQVIAADTQSENGL